MRESGALRGQFRGMELGDLDFRAYFVVQTPEMLERFEQYVAPAAALVDQCASPRSNPTCCGRC